MKRAHFVVHGRVQGVCFRMYTVEEASSLGLTGWVRNLQDGDVEIVAEGDELSLKELLTWCRRGPSFARVTRVTEEYSPAAGEFVGFQVRY